MQPVLYESESDSERHILFLHSYGGDSEMHFHQALEIVFVLKEQIIATLNGDTRIFYPGEIAVIPSYCLHSFRCPAGTEAYVFTISQNVISKLQEFTQISFSSVLPENYFTREIEAWLRRCEDVWPAANEPMRYGMVYYFIGLLQKAYSTTPKTPQRDNLIPEILNYIEEHYAEELTLKFLAGHFGYSKNYFSTLFNRITNMHLTEYLNRVRILRVKQELDDPQNTETILQTATKHGFNSLNTFYRALKKYTGRTEHRPPALHIRPHDICAAAETENCHASAMVCRSSPMAFFSSLDTCACEIPTSAEISVCVFPS